MKRLSIIIALLLTGCAGWRPDGRFLGVPMTTLEAPLNVAGKAAGVPAPVGSIVVGMDKAAVAAYGKRAEEYPYLGADRVYYTAAGQPVEKWAYYVDTPRYGAITSRTDTAQAPVILDAAALQQIAALYMQYGGKPPSIAIVPPPQTNALTDAEAKSKLDKLLSTDVIDGSEK